MTDIGGLIERVEAANGPDRELAADICETLGFQVQRGERFTRFGRRHPSWAFLAGGHWASVLPIMASVDAALGLVERVLPATPIELSGPPWSATLHNFINPSWHIEARGETAPLAILAALLRALSARSP